MVGNAKNKKFADYTKGNQSKLNAKDREKAQTEPHPLDETAAPAVPAEDKREVAKTFGS